jgi:DNA replication factor GINS
VRADRAPAADSAPGEPPASGDTTARPGDSEPPSPAPDGGAARPEPAPDATADRHDGPPTDDRPDRTTVRITDDVGSILGVDERTYDLAHDDVVTLPDPNAGALVESGAAERID